MNTCMHLTPLFMELVAVQGNHREADTAITDRPDSLDFRLLQYTARSFDISLHGSAKKYPDMKTPMEMRRDAGSGRRAGIREAAARYRAQERLGLHGTSAFIDEKIRPNGDGGSPIRL
jgi:hypothetical protein